jgi:hypothetical protein
MLSKMLKVGEENKRKRERMDDKDKPPKEVIKDLIKVRQVTKDIRPWFQWRVRQWE